MGWEFRGNGVGLEEWGQGRRMTPEQFLIWIIQILNIARTGALAVRGFAHMCTVCSSRLTMQQIFLKVRMWTNHPKDETAHRFNDGTVSWLISATTCRPLAETEVLIFSG